MNDSIDRYCTRISNKLNGSHVSAKEYWSILKMFLNDKNAPIIPLLFNENRFVTDFTKTAELFNSFFAKQCTVINSGISLQSELLLKTYNFLMVISFSSNNIMKIIQI